MVNFAGDRIEFRWFLSTRLAWWKVETVSGFAFLGGTLEPGKETSSVAPNSLSPLALLGILISSLAILWSLFKSQRVSSKRTSIHQQTPRTVTPTSKSAERSEKTICPSATVAQPPQSPKATDDSLKCCYEKTPRWKIILDSATFVVSACTLAAIIVYACITNEQKKQMIISNGLTQRALEISQGAHVTVGRPDGVVAEVVMPKTPRDQAGIVIYFQNTGHLPARFNWGTSSDTIDVLPTKPCCLWWKSDRRFQPMWRAKDRKTGQISWSGTSTIGGDSQYASTVGDIPKERMREFMNKEILYKYPPLSITGTFEYCDAMHTYQCRNFTLLYKREPYNRFMLVNEDECMGFQPVILNPKPELEYLSPCATGSEREEVKVPQGLTPIQH